MQVSFLETSWDPTQAEPQIKAEPKEKPGSDLITLRYIT